MKPMLAASTTPPLRDLKYPLLASPKLDGIRCLIVDGKAVSRSLKPIPNRFVRETLKEMNLPPLDGELMVKGDFNNVQSGIMSESGQPDFTYHVFDYRCDQKFRTRLTMARTEVIERNNPRLKSVAHAIIRDAEELQKYWDDCIEQGYEGAMVRDVYGPYKYGRSTLKQGWLVKLKKWHDDEGMVVGFEEQMHNENEATKGELGQTKRSHEKAGMVPADTLGALKLIWSGPNGQVEVTVGTGFDAATRKMIWNNQDKYKGKLVTFKYQELSKYGQPRFPVFMRFRGNE